ncbi:MAG: glycoside hydrolase family 4 [Actinomycetia bacterium]|nr:glycoside hydrolase family 4 [Actinomycetes bacterium]
MAPRITIIGGGSFQWVPKLLVDLANTPTLHEAELVLEDIDASTLDPMAEFVEHVAKSRGIPLSVRTTTDQRDALEGADYVVVSISTGGFDSMRHDIEIPERYGIRQAVGDTVGPGGVVRALRNIPVLVGIARDMEELCPDAWLLNITNPMTTLCRAITRETAVKTVGLCHEVTNCRYQLSQLLDRDFRDFDLDVEGVNHLPIITRLDVNGDDGFALISELLERGSDDKLKHALLESNRVKFELFGRFGVLPAAGDRHLVEFFPGFLTEESGWGERWGVQLTTIEDREQWLDYYKAEFKQMREASEIPKTMSGEMVAPLIDSFITGKERHLPLNVPNTGQCPDLPNDVVVESICVTSDAGVRGGTETRAPFVLGEWLRRISSSQEATVEAALTGSHDTAVDAMLLDPLAGRIDFDRLEQMTDEMLSATSRWLPQFA